MQTRSRKIVVIGVVALGLLTLTASAGAATLQVSTTGTDSPTCGPVTPCLTIQQAVTNSMTNDTVQIGAGTFTVKNITVGNKNLTINGAGTGATVIDGADATDAAAQAAFRFNGNGTTSTISNLTFQRLARNSANPQTPARAIWVQPSAVGNSTSVTISNVDVHGSDPAITPAVTALGSSVNTGTLNINNVHTFSLNGNSLLLERHRGPATVQNSNFQQATTTAGFAIYDFSYGGAPADVTGAHTFTNNAFSGTNGIFVNAGFASANAAESSFLGQITIADNQFSSPIPTSTAIRLENTPIGAASSTATMNLVSISGNSQLGNGASGVGVKLTGKIAGSVISNNNVRGFATGVELANSTKSPGDAPSGTQLNRNQLVDNGGAAKTGLATGSAVTGVDATNNWWGCNAGPPVGAAAQAGDCDSAALADVGSAVVEPHMVLGIAVGQQPTLGDSASSGVTGAITQNSQGAVLTNVIPDGTTYQFSGTGGFVSAPTAPTTAGTAGVVFTSTALAGRTASVTYDHQTVTHAWPNNDMTPPAITITGPPKQRSVIDQPSITLNYTVSEGATCSPPPGSTVNLDVGLNTIVVTCVDATGNVSTASVQVVRPDVLPACAASVVITNVKRSGSKSIVSGYARLRYAGQKISLRYMPSGTRTIARPTVRSNGSWSATVKRPKSPSYKSNDARYRAVLGKTKTRWIKLTRRMGSTTVTSASTGTLNVKGSVSKPLAPGQRVRVERSDACGKYRQVGSVRVKSSGGFSGKVSDGGSSDVAVFIRLKLKVRSSSGKRFNTYSIVQPVILKR